MELETIVVLAPALGAAPFEFPKVGEFGEVARNKTYPFAVAPVPGKVALVQDKSIFVEEVALALKLPACAVAGFDNVLKVFSSP